MRKYTQKALREMAREGLATNVTDWSHEQVKELLQQPLDKIGYSSGVNGINGGMLENRENGERYVVTARNSTLFMIF